LLLNRSETQTTEEEEEGRITSTWVEIINKAAASFLLCKELFSFFFINRK